MTKQDLSVTGALHHEETLGAALRRREGDPSIALRFGDHSWTWHEYYQEASQRSHWMLSRRRSTAPFHVGVLMENSAEYAFLLAGAALSGATVVGLNLTRGPHDLAHDIAHSDCQLVIAQPEFFDPGLGSPEVLVRADAQYLVEVATFPRAAPIVEVAAQDLFSLVFTSGTTSAPKAVRCSQASMYTRATRIVDIAQLDSDDVVYISMPMFHSNSLILSWAPAVIVGATMVLRRRFSPSAFVTDVMTEYVTYANYVGKALSFVLDVPAGAGEQDSSLRLLYGNEAASRVIRSIERRFGCRVIDGFGSTEGGIGFSRTDDSPENSIGRARGNVQVLDSVTGQRQVAARTDASGKVLNPEAAIGELVNVGGIGSFEGYYRNEAAMAERVRDGSYWSGDLGYVDENGFFFHAGRVGDWVRVDGENLAVGPIEMALTGYEDFLASAVFGVDDPASGQRLMLVAELARGAAFRPEHFAQWLASQPSLGSKAHPQFVRIISALPRTATNKLQRQSLVASGWDVADDVWWRPPRESAYVLFDRQARAQWLAEFARFGR